MPIIGRHGEKYEQFRGERGQECYNQVYWIMYYMSFKGKSEDVCLSYPHLGLVLCLYIAQYRLGLHYIYFSHKVVWNNQLTVWNFLDILYKP